MTVKYKISFIIPVFNSKEYLKECVNSIVLQPRFNVGDIQIVLADDGSTDVSSAICDMYADMFENVKALHGKNAGVSSARNAGIAAAEGEYIAFADSDDFLLDGILTSVVDELEKSSPDMLFFNYKYDHGGDCEDIVFPRFRPQIYIRDNCGLYDRRHKFQFRME